MSAPETRAMIVETADDLFYQQGFERTSFADIAARTGLSRGNFYYHFRTKDDILDAVIERRLAMTREMLASWSAGSESPEARIRCFIRILIMNRAKIMAWGCPVGTLSSELSKLDHVARQRAAGVFELFRDWLAAEFAALGAGKEAEPLALHLLMRSQGVATLAAAFRDKAFVAREVDEMCRWLDGQIRRFARDAN